MIAPQLAAALISATASVVLTALVGAIAWYLRGEYREHKKNTAVRRYLVGDPALEEIDDEGYVDDVDDRFDELRAQHEQVRRDVQEVKTLVERIAALLESSDDFDFTRGSARRGQQSDDD